MLFRMLFAVLLNPPLVVTMIRPYLVTCHPPGGGAIFWSMHLDQNIKLIDIECDCCNVEFNIGINTVVIIFFFVK